MSCKYRDTTNYQYRKITDGWYHVVCVDSAFIVRVEPFAIFERQPISPALHNPEELIAQLVGDCGEFSCTPAPYIPDRS